MIGSVYDAFRKAGVDEGAARAAAEDVASYDNRLTVIEAKIDALSARVDAKFEQQTANFDAKFDLLSSRLDSLEKRTNMMFGILAAINVATLGLVLRTAVG